MYKWSIRGKYSRNRLIHLWGLAASFHPATHPMPKFPLQYSCQAINLWLNLFADRICIRSSILPYYSIVCLWIALTIKSPFFFGNGDLSSCAYFQQVEVVAPGKQFGLVEGVCNLELEGLGADPGSDSRGFWTVFLPSENLTANAVFWGQREQVYSSSNKTYQGRWCFMFQACTSPGQISVPLTVAGISFLSL